MMLHEVKKRAAPERTTNRYSPPKNKSSPYGGLTQMASLVGNSAMEAYLRQEVPPRSNAIAPESGGQELPPSLRERMEARTGISLDDVRVHYNSDKPAKLGALAYARGNEVHVGPGQEKHLEHELGHVVQQKAGMVKPTGEIGGMSVNEEARLESLANSSLNLVNIYDKSTNAPLSSLEIIQKQSFPRYSGEKRNYNIYGETGSMTLGKDCCVHIDKYGQNTGTPPNSIIAGVYNKLRGYVRGHIINQKLGGSGDNPNNLFPFSSSTNSNHEKTMECHAKALYGNFVSGTLDSEIATAKITNPYFYYRCWLTGTAAESSTTITENNVDDITINGEWGITNGINNSIVARHNDSTLNAVEPDPEYAPDEDMVDDD